MQLLPEMKSNGEGYGYSCDIKLEYWQNTFAVNDLIKLLVMDISNVDVYLDTYNYILDNQKKLLNKILSSCVLAWNEWILESPRAQSYKNLPPINTGEHIVRLFHPFYIDIEEDDDNEFSFANFSFEPREGQLEMFNQFYLIVNTQKGNVVKIKLELDNIPYIPKKYRSEDEKAWYIAN